MELTREQKEEKVYLVMFGKACPNCRYIYPPESPHLVDSMNNTEGYILNDVGDLYMRGNDRGLHRLEGKD